MVEVGVAELQNAWAALLEQVLRGEEIVIMREGTAIAKLVSPSPQTVEVTEKQRTAAQAAFDRIRERAKTLPKEAFDWEAMKTNLGRKYC